MNLRPLPLLALGAPLFALILAAASCGPTAADCGPHNCATGCCEADGTCSLGNLPTACGSGGGMCLACTAGQYCSSGACLAFPASKKDGGQEETDGGACLGLGDFCVSPSECCSGLCNASFQCADPGGTDGGCFADGQGCSAGTQCCSGVCDGTSGTCGNPNPMDAGCRPDGQACSTGAQCCSQMCNSSFTCGATNPMDGGTVPGDVCAQAIPFNFAGGFAFATGTTAGAANDVNTSSAGCSDASGGDVFYRFTVSAPSNLQVSLLSQSSAYTPAVHLRQSCTSASLSCTVSTGGGGTANLSFGNLAPGTYHLVVDGALGSAGPFDLSANLTPVGPGPTGTYCVATYTSNSVLRFDRQATGTATPVGALQGATTGLNGPWRLTRTSAGDLYAANYNGSDITVHAATASGGVAPTRVITSPAVTTVAGITVDEVHSELLVSARAPNNVVLAFPLFASGALTPLRAMPYTGNQNTLAYNPVHDEYCLGGSGSLSIFARTDTSGTALRTISGFSNVHACAFDLQRDELVVLDDTGGIYVYSRTHNGTSSGWIRQISSSGLNDLRIDEAAGEYVAIGDVSPYLRVFSRLQTTSTPVRTMDHGSGGNFWGLELCP